MQTVNANKAGLAFGTLLGAFHAMWATLIALRWAQPIVDFVFRIHMIRPIYVIAPFNIWLALTLIAVTGATGYVGGFALAALWNWLYREPHKAATQSADWYPGSESSVH